MKWEIVTPLFYAGSRQEKIKFAWLPVQVDISVTLNPHEHRYKMVWLEKYKAHYEYKTWQDDCGSWNEWTYVGGESL